jgi:hypothetical protein
MRATFLAFKFRYSLEFGSKIRGEGTPKTLLFICSRNRQNIEAQLKRTKPKCPSQCDLAPHKMIVLLAMDFLVDAELAQWTMSPPGAQCFELATGEIYELEPEIVRRVR